jgi:hypothetical protein
MEEVREVAYLKGKRSWSSSTESTRPYHGHIMKICEEYAMKMMRDVVKPTQMRPRRRPMASTTKEDSASLCEMRQRLPRVNGNGNASSRAQFPTITPKTKPSLRSLVQLSFTPCLPNTTILKISSQFAVDDAVPHTSS